MNIFGLQLTSEQIVSVIVVVATMLGAFFNWRAQARISSTSDVTVARESLRTMERTLRDHRGALTRAQKTIDNHLIEVSASVREIKAKLDMK